MKKITIIIMLAFIGLSINAQTAINPKNSLGSARHNALNQLSSGRDINSVQFKPCKEVDSNWDTIANVWNYNDSVRSTYNSSGNVTLELRYYGGTFPDKTTYYYNANGKETSDTAMNWNGTAYIYLYLNAYTYDGNGNQTEQLQQNWNGTSWNGNYKDDYTFDGSNNLTEEIDQNWSGSALVNSWKGDYTWTGGQMTEEIDQNWSGSAWVNSGKEDLTYASGQCNGATDYSWNGTSWQNKDNIINVIWYQWNGNIDNSYPASLTEQVPNGSLWKDTIKDAWTYDSHGNVTDYLEQSKPGSTYITTDEEKDIFQYDGNNNITEDIYQNWNTVTQNVRNDTKKDYSDFFQYTGINEITKEDNVKVYPNPASDIVTLNIDNTNNEAFTLNIYNVIGSLVKSETLKPNNAQINVGDLSNGVYMVTIKSKDFTANQRLIIQR